MNPISAQCTLLTNELYDTFKQARLTTDKAHFTSIVDYFFQILHLSVGDTDLEELGHFLEPIVVSSFEDNRNQKRSDFRTLATTVEPWLKKLLLLFHPAKYKEYKKEKRTAAAYCEYFHLIPPQGKKPAFTLQKQMKETYNWRNKESHTATSLSNTELSNQILYAWICYLYPVAKHFADLRKIVAQHQMPDLRPYLKGVLQKYQDWKKRFVAIKGYQFNYMYGKAREEKTDITDRVPAVIEQSIQKWRDDVVQKARKSKWKRANNMLVWGTAGTGKSTTLMVLSFQDAEYKIADYEDLHRPIPVFLPLNILDREQNLLAHIAEELVLSIDKTKSLLEKGYLHLYLDGFNEITTRYGFQTVRKKEIQRFFSKYPKTFILLTTRPEEEASFRGMRTFELLPMDKVQMRLFLERNTIKPNTRQIISDRIQLEKIHSTTEYTSLDATIVFQAQQLFQLLQTPLFLFYLIQIVDQTQEIPESEAAIIKAFVGQLLDREKADKDQTEMHKKNIQLLLSMIGYHSFEKYGTNAGMSSLWLESIVFKLIENYNLTFEVQPFYKI